jgi:predicted amidohydrolase YtcJ
MGWNHRDWERPEFPGKEPLDRIARANPIALERKDKHSLWLNSAALHAANITRETPDPVGGVIVRDADGEPTGLLREQAVRLGENAIGPAAFSLRDEELQAAISSAHRVGLTGIHNVEGAGALRAFERLRARDRLTLRVTQMIPADNLAHAVALGLEAGFGDEFLRIGGVKIFADGSLGSQTAHMLEPFVGQPENRGLAVTPPAEIEQMARTAANAHLMVVTHAIGDRANRDVLNVYEQLRREGVQATLRIEHAQHLHPTDIPRFATLNVVASVQPIHATSDYLMADQLLGSRARYAYAFKSLLRTGARLIFGSDCPVETLDPIAGLHAAVTRERANGEPRGGWYPAERLAVEEALRAYADPLRIGGLADCVILSEDILAVPPQHLLETCVEQTIVGGKIVYSG